MHKTELVEVQNGRVGPITSELKGNSERSTQLNSTQLNWQLSWVEL